MCLEILTLYYWLLFLHIFLKLPLPVFTKLSNRAMNQVNLACGTYYPHPTAEALSNGSFLMGSGIIVFSQIIRAVRKV